MIIPASVRPFGSARWRGKGPTALNMSRQEFVDRYASKKRTGVAIAQLIKREVVARWAKRPITDIARRDVIAMVEEIGEDSPSAAHQALIYCRRLFSWAISRDAYGLETSPCDRVAAIYSSQLTACSSQKYCVGGEGYGGHKPCTFISGVHMRRLPGLQLLGPPAATQTSYCITLAGHSNPAPSLASASHGPSIVLVNGGSFVFGTGTL